MGSTREIPTGEPFELSQETVGLERTTGRARFMDWASGGPPRIDGYTVGAPLLRSEPPHAGEMHPDADELLYLVSGRVRVRLELDGGDRDTELGPGQALVVPRGVWHRIFIEEPGRLVHITPGPGGQLRALPGPDALHRPDQHGRGLPLPGWSGRFFHSENNGCRINQRSLDLGLTVRMLCRWVQRVEPLSC